MKKTLICLLAGAGSMLASCVLYDDSPLLERMDGLEDRVTKLEETIAALNQDIAGVKTLVEALNNNVYVSRIVEGEKGYTVFFTDGKQIDISNGEAGKDGVSVTVIFDESDGQWYWATDQNGVKTAIEVDGRRLPVKGEKGNTPQLRVVMEDETGYWEVSYDNGETWSRILLEDGTPVTTSGGAGGLFRSAGIDEESNTAYFEFLNGERITIELRSDCYINFKKGEAVEDVAFRPGETKTFELEVEGVLKTVVTKPDEWSASFDLETSVLTVTAPAEEHAACADQAGDVSLIYFGGENQSSVVSVKVHIGRFVEVAEEKRIVEAAKEGGTLTVEYTSSDDMLRAEVNGMSAGWLTATPAEGVLSIVVSPNTGAPRSGVITLIAADNSVDITVNQAEGVALYEKGYNPASLKVDWSKALSGLSLTASAVNSVAATTKYVIVGAPNEVPVVLDAETGEKVGSLDLGPMEGRNYYVTTDQADHILINSYNDGGHMRVARMKDIDETPEIFIDYESADFGKRISVTGDVYGDAIITAMYSPWSTGTTSHQRWVIEGGKAPAKPTWSNVTDGANNNNGDVMYRDPSVSSPCFMIGYSSNSLCWIENGTCLRKLENTECTATNNEGAVCLDILRFNKVAYALIASDSYFNYGQSSLVLVDVTSQADFKVVHKLDTDKEGWSAHVTTPNGSALTDCALGLSADGTELRAYVVFANGSVGCLKADCLAE